MLPYLWPTCPVGCAYHAGTRSQSALFSRNVGHPRWKKLIRLVPKHFVQFRRTIGVERAATHYQQARVEGSI